MNPTTPTIPKSSIYGDLLSGSAPAIPDSQQPSDARGGMLQLNQLPLYALNYYRALVERRQINPTDAMSQISDYVTPQGNGNAYSIDTGQLGSYLGEIGKNIFRPVGQQDNKTTVDVSGMSTDTKNYQYGTGQLLATEKNPTAPSTFLPEAPRGNYAYQLPTAPKT